MQRYSIFTFLQNILFTLLSGRVAGVARVTRVAGVARVARVAGVTRVAKVTRVTKITRIARVTKVSLNKIRLHSL